MKIRYYTNVILIIVLLLSPICFCTSQEKVNSYEKNSVLYTRIPNIYDFYSLSTKYKNINYEKIVRSFCLKFNPPKYGGGLPKLTNKIIYCFWKLKNSQNDKFEKYIILIVIKVYRKHMQYSHQSYDLRNIKSLTKMEDLGETGCVNMGINPVGDYLLYEFAMLTKYWDPDACHDYIFSHRVLDFVEKNRRFLKNKEINQEYKIIKRIHKNIKEGFYWN